MEVEQNQTELQNQLSETVPFEYHTISGGPETLLEMQEKKVEQNAVAEVQQVAPLNISNIHENEIVQQEKNEVTFFDKESLNISNGIIIISLDYGWIPYIIFIKSLNFLCREREICIK